MVIWLFSLFNSSIEMADYVSVGRAFTLFSPSFVLSTNSHHVLYQLIPPEKATDYNLRKCYHKLTLPQIYSNVFRNNFIFPNAIQRYLGLLHACVYNDSVYALFTYCPLFCIPGKIDYFLHAFSMYVSHLSVL